ncbi:MAG: glycosyltransferase involved in cell wall biosynthesis [Flavobacteriaceae bacterium]|jgi:glycosyltransferase involved in cell wall biosynthesis|uniref:glycosyltransferase family protein n=1 Tax=Candidatus Marifrigoribacter sp. Uisw_064 TaxID=3230970 RepID=UPI003AE2B68E
MRILLIGEYSRLHNSLKKGLVELGHEVTLVGTGDLFKNYPVDISIKPTLFSYRTIPLFIRKVFLRLIKRDLALWEIGYRFQKVLPKLKGYDVVQLINSHSIGTFPKKEKKLLKVLFQQNKNIFLMACGDDYPVIKHYLEGNERYHILTPHFESKGKIKAEFALKYMTTPYKDLFYFAYNHSKAVIPSDIDYKLPWASWNKVMTVIPNPILIPEYYQPIECLNRKIIIFLGINTLNYTKKGYQYFEEALNKLAEKHADKVDIRCTKNLPFNEYVHHLESCDILLDAIFQYDQGYNALEAMARGKVVFTGAEKEFEEHYQLKNKVNINALPDVDSIYTELEQLILNPEKINEIGENARLFIEKEHNHKKVAEKYINTWERF